MRLTSIAPIVLLLVLVGLIGPARSQIEIPDESADTIEFMLIYSSFDLAFDVWTDTEPPDTVILDAYAVASGFLAGIPFHYERNRDRLTIIEQVDAASDSLVFKGHSILDGGYLRFDYELDVKQSDFQDATTGSSYAGHGSCELAALDEARDEARMSAFEEAIRTAITETYTRRNQPIPGVLDGRISWHEIVRDERDPETGNYIFDINAWVKFDER